MWAATESNELLRNDEIRSRPCPTCYVCGNFGTDLYQRTRDRLFNATGSWTLKRCANSECGLVWLDPKPLDKDISKAYKGYYTHRQVSEPDRRQRCRKLLRFVYRQVKSNYLAHKYGYDFGLKAPLNFIVGRLMYLFPGRRASVDFGALYLPAKLEGHLLDVGCGTGELLKGMQALGWQTEGVDFDPAAARNARSKGLKVHVGSLEEQKFADSTFDAVTMSHLIEHVPDPVTLLRECYRLLKSGGYLVIITPNVNSWGHRLYRTDWRGLEPPRHLHIFAPAPLRAVLLEAGFHKVQMSTTIRAADFYFISSRELQRAGTSEMGVRYRWTVRLWGRAMAMLEWARLMFNSQVGEEIAVLAQ